MLNHVANVVCWYSTSLATETRERAAWPRHDDHDSSVHDLVRVVADLAAVLAAVASNAGDTVRAFHSEGMADRAGFLAMASDELLVHTWDIGTAFNVDFMPTAALVAPVLGRLFQGAPSNVDSWPALLWSNGRIALPDRPRERIWSWQCAPPGDPNTTAS